MNTELVYNSIENAGEIFHLNRKVLILTDAGVPEAYAEKLAAQAKNANIITVSCGERSKSMETVSYIISRMLLLQMERGDALVAVGGGVVTDLGGFVAGIYKRGITFYSVPTTVLAQCDAAIGGKTGVNFDSYKNVVGLFYPAKIVLMDTSLLSTLPERIFREGMAEVIKMAVTLDRDLFEMLERADDVQTILPQVVKRCGELKMRIVEEDPYEKNVRKVLNFGHTFGHAIESALHGELLHGECVALGMMPMCGEEVKKRLRAVLKKYGLFEVLNREIDFNDFSEYLLQDKKRSNGRYQIIMCHEIGAYELREIDEAGLMRLYSWRKGIKA